MVETAIANKLNLYEYLVYLFDTLPKINNDDVDNLRKLLPYSPDLPKYLKVQYHALIIPWLLYFLYTGNLYRLQIKQKFLHDFSFKARKKSISALISYAFWNF